MPKEIQKIQEKIRIQANNTEMEVPAGSTLEEISHLFKISGSTLVGAKYNNAIMDLHEQIWLPGQVDFIDVRSEDGQRIYRQSLVFLLTWAAYELNPADQILIKHSLGQSYYCEIKDNWPAPALQIMSLEAKMRELIAADLPIVPQVLAPQEAKEAIAKYGPEDTAELLDSMNWREIRFYAAGQYANFSNRVLVPRTGLLDVFKLEPYSQGFIIRFPDVENPDKVAPRYKLPKLAQVWHESEEWAGILGVRNVAGLLDLLARHPSEANTLIHVSEALQEKKIAQIADEIFAKRDKIRVVLIAGPSSSGKTTFAQRLSIQLRVLGLLPTAISTDDYFLDREKTPRDEYGEYDFEALEAVDLPLFNQQLQEIIRGNQVVCPIYDFHSGKRVMPGRVVQCGIEHPVIIEGIHALNEKLTDSVPRENKYKIYISALTQISVDEHNRINTTDTRLIRRIVRDSQFRSQPALRTLQRWNSVRRGEEKNIFPFQEDADMMFNSALVYELSILKKYAYPLLKAISPQDKEYSDARRLLRLLDFFPEIADKYVPLNSILREFIGGSSIHEK